MNYLLELRKKANLTQQEVADRAGVGKSTIVKLEAGQIQPRTDTCEKLARALGTKPGTLARALLAQDTVRRRVLGSDRSQVSPDQVERRSELISELSQHSISGDEAEAVAFVALVNLFRVRLAEQFLRPEAYWGYVAAGRKLLEHAEHIGRALQAENEANFITNGELDILDDPLQLQTALTGFRRWEGCHRDTLHTWLGAPIDPEWHEALVENAEDWERRLSPVEEADDSSRASEEEEVLT